MFLELNHFIWIKSGFFPKLFLQWSGELFLFFTFGHQQAYRYASSDLRNFSNSKYPSINEQQTKIAIPIIFKYRSALPETFFSSAAARSSLTTPSCSNSKINGPILMLTNKNHRFYIAFLKKPFSSANCNAVNRSGVSWLMSAPFLISKITISMWPE